MASKEAREERILSFSCATFWRCYEDSSWTKLLRDCCEAVCPVGHTLVPKSMQDRKHVFFSGTCCGNLLNRRHNFHHVPPCCNGMEALLSRDGKGTKPTQVLKWEMTAPGSNLAPEDMAVCGHRRNRQPWRQRWLQLKQRLAGLGAAAGYWTWLLDPGPQGAHGKAAGPGLVPVQRDYMETDHPKILLRHFQTPAFSSWRAGLEMHRSRMAQSPPPPASRPPGPGARPALAQVQAIATGALKPPSPSRKRCFYFSCFPERLRASVPMLEEAHAMSGPGFAGSSGCAVTVGVQHVPALWLTGNGWWERSTGPSLPERPGSPLALPRADEMSWEVEKPRGLLEVAGGLVVLPPFSKDMSPWLQGSQISTLPHVSRALVRPTLPSPSSEAALSSWSRALDYLLVHLTELLFPIEI